MLWLAWYFPALPLEVVARADTEPTAQAAPLAVSIERAGRLEVFRANAAAADAGVTAGMAVSAALARCATLQVRPRDPAAEQRALEGLAQAAYGYSPRLCFEPLTLLLEIAGSLRLFGGLDPLLAALDNTLAGFGYQGRHAVAPTPGGAALLARARPGSRALDLAALHTLVEALPLRTFRRRRQERELIAAIGLHSIGDCLRLPRPALARRSGPALLQALDRLLGQIPDPRPPWQPPAHFSGQLALLHEITTAGALLFPARRLVQDLCSFLLARGGATQQLDWTLRAADGSTQTLQLGLLQPDRDAARITELLRIRLERLTLQAPVRELHLRVSRWTAQAAPSEDLFAPARRPLLGLLERLQGRLGEQALHALQPVADHRPERACRRCPPGPPPSAIPASPEPREQPGHPEQPAAPRPLWLLPQPQRLREQAGRPLYQGPLRLLSATERIETGWWDGGEMARDYYMACAVTGRRAWIYREHDSGDWYLHGWFD